MNSEVDVQSNPDDWEVKDEYRLPPGTELVPWLQANGFKPGDVMGLHYHDFRGKAHSGLYAIAQLEPAASLAPLKLEQTTGQHRFAYEAMLSIPSDAAFLSAFVWRALPPASVLVEGSPASEI